MDYLTYAVISVSIVFSYCCLAQVTIPGTCTMSTSTVPGTGTVQVQAQVQVPVIIKLIAIGISGVNVTRILT